MRKLLFLFLSSLSFALSQQSTNLFLGKAGNPLIADTTITPEIYSWRRNTTGAVGYNNIPADVQHVFYASDYVYVSSTNIPSYHIGPWNGNPNVASNQNFTFKITRTPTQNTGTKTATSLGHIGVLSNGVTIFNAKDAMSYNNQNIWHQNAVVVEAPSFDTCFGHPQQHGEYHHHQNPKCLYTPIPNEHSPIVGYAFDGFPLYGSNAFANTNGTGNIVRMKTSFRKRNITQRRTLPNGTILPSNQYGPNISTQYPLGYYIEDYEFVIGLGDLDSLNGRFSVTPEYPNGTYAYFATMDSSGIPVYPYLIGPYYFGIVTAGNTGPNSGHNTIPDSAVEYTGTTGVRENNFSPSKFSLLQNYPNPFNPTTKLSFVIGHSSLVNLTVYNILGKEIATLIHNGLTDEGMHEIEFDATSLPSGLYFYRLQTEKFSETKKMVLLK
ncbi:MAG: YHYH protein [Ignavibacteriales bacterium]|nr:YHYH protein [Ignavibacteriales bacterium]